MMTDPRFRGDLLITDRISLEELVEKGFHALLNEKDKHVKVLVRPS
jgi:(R,R)-butanediol dehydrogenase/meso-butanediol dehydrogenase/diacetyl reductase